MKEYHLIDRTTGESHGGFATLNGARQYALEEGLRCWQIFKGWLRIETHDPLGPEPANVQ